jgi:hypothetical protein
MGQNSLLDDFEAGSNQNKFLGYTYYYADAGDGGNSTISSALPGTGDELLFDATVSVGPGYGGSTNALLLDFKFGTTKPTCGAGCTYGQSVGVGTEFVGKGNVLDMTGATAITFWAKASEAMIARVEVATKPVTNFGYHRYEASLTTTWSQITVPLVEGPGFAQPAWAATADPIAFDPTQIEKLQIQISADDNLTTTAGQVWIDDITVVGYSWVPPTACMTCLGAVGAGTGALVADMEGTAKNKNKSGGYWYAYTDIGTRVVASQAEYSEIIAGAVPDSVDPSKPAIAISGLKGAAGTDGAYLSFALGPPFAEAGNTIQPFVGMGTTFQDPLGTTFTNASASTGISFDYWTNATGNINFLIIEAITSVDYGNAGITHSVLMPATAGEWRSASIPWTKFLLPPWDEVALIADQTLKTNALAKIQWSYKGSQGQKGEFAIDNVKFIGMTTAPEIGAGILQRNAQRTGGMQWVAGRGKMEFGFTMPEGLNRGRLEIFDARGSIVGSRSIQGNGFQHLVWSGMSLKQGVYAARISFDGGSQTLQSRLVVMP